MLTRMNGNAPSPSSAWTRQGWITAKSAWSPRSPAPLLRARVGDWVQVRKPGGEDEVEIRAIAYPAPPCGLIAAHRA